MKDIRQSLQMQNKNWLVDRLVELSQVDSSNADRILLSMVAEEQSEAKIVANFRSQLDKAVAEIEEHGPATWKSELSTDGFDSVGDALTIVLSKNMLNAVIETSEYALLKLDSIFELQNECELEYLVDAFRHLHLEACNRLKPSPSALGARLAELGRQTEWGFFDGPPAGYAPILGQDGLSEFLAK